MVNRGRVFPPTMLEHVKNEMVAGVVASIAGIFVMPLPVINRNLHFCGITMVKAVAAAIVLVALEVLWVENVWVVIESLNIAIAARSTPNASVGSWVCRVGRIDA